MINSRRPPIGKMIGCGCATQILIYAVMMMTGPVGQPSDPVSERACEAIGFSLAIGGLIGPIGIWLLVWRTNRRDDPRRQQPPPDAP